LDKEEKQFNDIVEMLVGQNIDVEFGKMMSCQAVIYKKKVFAFYHQKRKEIVFKLGKDFNPKEFGITDFSLLNPFKNKPPMTAWFHIPSQFSDKWNTLAGTALNYLISEIDKK